MIAVLIPAHNTAKYLSDCLDSVLAQTYKNIEIHVINDGSTDDTEKVLKSYAKKDKRLHIYTQKNQGLTKTRNILLSKISPKVDFVFHLDSDDFLHPQALELMLKYIKQYKADVAEGRVCKVSADSSLKDIQPIVVSDIKVNLVNDMSVFWVNKTRVGNWINAASKLYRWNAVKNLRFSEKLAHEEDYFYSCEVNAQVKRKVLISIPHYYYRQNPTSMSHHVNYDLYIHSAINRIQLSYDTFLKTHRVPKKYLAAFKNDLANDAYRMIVRKNTKKNKNRQQCRALFNLASDSIIRFQKEEVVDFSTLPLLKKMALWACIHKAFFLTKLLVLLAN